MNLLDLDKRIESLLMRLYDASVFREAQGTLEGDTPDADLTDQLIQELSELEMEADAKIANLHKAIRYYDAMEAVVREEEKVLARKRKSIENHSIRLKRWVAFVLDGRKWTDGVRLFYFQNFLNVVDEEFDKIPEEYIRTKPAPREVDKDTLGTLYRDWKKRLANHHKAEADREKAHRKSGSKEPFVALPFTEPEPRIPGVSFVERPTLMMR